MRDLDRWKDKVEISLDGRQIFFLFFGSAVAACLIFGEYRIIETEIASHFNVSRTVVRDVLGRLQERGLVRKSQSSRWLAGPKRSKLARGRLAYPARRPEPADLVERTREWLHAAGGRRVVSTIGMFALASSPSRHICSGPSG